MFENVTEEQFAYLAGIIDGEGCVYIGSHSCNKVTKAAYFAHYIQVANSDKCLIDWLFAVFGGTTAKYTRAQTPKNARKDPYFWKVTGELLTGVCLRTLPYYVIKRPQVEVMLEMRKTYDQHPSQRKKVNPNGVQPLSQELIDLRFSIMHKLRALRD